MLKGGKYPDLLKVAHITPLYKKKGERCDVKSYRPSSVLPTTTKIIEAVLIKKLTHHFETNSILMKEQHGYRKARLTQSAITVLTDSIKKAADNKNLPGVVFVDYVQAFDCVQYDKLLEKYHKYGVRGKLLELLQSYFTNKQIIVCKDGQRSDPIWKTQGTPQGSSVSSLNFAIYINDTSDIFQNCKFTYYADDLAVFAHRTTVEEVQEKLQKDLPTYNNGAKLTQ